MIPDERVEQLMRRAQAGCSGPYPVAQECVHSYMADTYGVLGQLLMDRRRLLHALEMLYESQPFSDSEGWREANAVAGKTLADVRGES